MIILPINTFTVCLEKYSKTLTLLFYVFFKFHEFSKILVRQKYQYIVGIAVQSQELSKYGNVANNKCIQKRTILVVLYKVKKIQGKLSESKFASQSFANLNKPSKSKVNIPLYKHDIHPCTICFLVQEDIFVTFFPLANNIFNFSPIKCLAQGLYSLWKKMQKMNMLLLLQFPSNKNSQ